MTKKPSHGRVAHFMNQCNQGTDRSIDYPQVKKKQQQANADPDAKVSPAPGFYGMQLVAFSMVLNYFFSVSWVLLAFTVLGKYQATITADAAVIRLAVLTLGTLHAGQGTRLC